MTNLFDSFKTVPTWHLQIHQNYVKPCLGSCLKRQPSVAGALHFEGLSPQGVAGNGLGYGIVVHHQHPAAAFPTSTSPAPDSMGSLNGKVTVKTLPFPNSLFTEIDPSSKATSFCATAKS